MRWERLFRELEQHLEDDERCERDELAADLRDESWFGTPWTELLGGSARLEVEGAGFVAGAVTGLGRDFARLLTDEGEVLVALGAVLAVLDWDRRRPGAADVTSRLGWGSALRALRDEAEPVRLVRTDGKALTGQIAVVGQDFLSLDVVDLSAGSSRTQISVPWSRLSLVRPTR